MPQAVCEKCGKTLDWRNQRGVRLADFTCPCGGKFRRPPHAAKRPYTHGWCVYQALDAWWHKGRLLEHALTKGQAAKRCIALQQAGQEVAQTCRTAEHPAGMFFSRAVRDLMADFGRRGEALDALCAIGMREPTEIDVALHSIHCACHGTGDICYPSGIVEECKTWDVLHVSQEFWVRLGRPRTAEALFAAIAPDARTKGG